MSDFRIKYESLLSLASDGCIIYDPCGDILEFNEGAYLHLGYSPEEFRRLRLPDLFLEDDLQKRPLRFDAMQHGQTVVDFRRIKRKDGSDYLTELRSVLLPDGKIMAMARDMTEHTKIRKELRMKEHAIESSISGMGIGDLNGIIIYANKALCKMWGAVNEQELIGRDVRDMFDGPLILQNIDTVKANGIEYSECLGKKLDGTLFPVAFSANIVTDHKNDPVYLFGSFLDISGQKDSEQQLKQRYDQLQLLARLSDAVSKARQLEDIYKLALGGLLTTIQADRASVLLFDEAGIMQFKASHGLSGEYCKLATGHSPWKSDAVNPAPIYVSDVASDPDLDALRPVIEAEGIKALGFIPLIYMNRLLGKFMVYFNTEHVFTEDESQLLQTIAREVAFAIGEKESQLVLQKSEQKYRDVVNNSRDIIFRADKTGTLTFLNPAWHEILGFSESSSLGNSILTYVYEDDCSSCQSKLGLLISGQEEFCRHKFRLVTKDQRICWFEVNARMVNGSNATDSGIIGVLTDISERKKYEQALEETNLELRNLSAHLQDVREEERTSIAREIHDELGQQLTVLKIEFSWLQSQIQPEKSGMLSGKFDEIGRHLDGAVNTIRELSANLRPLMLDDLGLVATVKWYLEDIQRRVNIRTEFRYDEDDIPLPEKVRTALFRIIQESVTNVIRHSGATVIIVTLVYQGGKIRLEIKDNGKGFDTAYVSGKRTLGLLGMKERTSLMGGACNVESIPGLGTTVLVEVHTDAGF